MQDRRSIYTNSVEHAQLNRADYQVQTSVRFECQDLNSEDNPLICEEVH